MSTNVNESVGEHPRIRCSSKSIVVTSKRHEIANESSGSENLISVQKTLCCDKCDGKHETANCPYYKKQRDNHPDAQRGGKKMGGTSNLPYATIKNARVVRQPGDGSCLFHSMSYGLRDGSVAASLREEICSFLLKNPNLDISDSPISDWVRWDSGNLGYRRSCKRIKRWNQRFTA